MPLPDFLPILDARMARGDHRPTYAERELTEPRDLCDASGRLDPAAVGWSRGPLVRANLSGHWPRKKRWNFWNWIAPEFVLSVTVADLDYAAFCEVTFTDLATGTSTSALAPRWPGSIALAEHVERSLEVDSKAIEYRNVHRGDALEVTLRAQAKDVPIRARFVTHKPAQHETLNLVVPWTPDRFQLNSKHAALPTEGEIEVGGRRWVMRPDECHGVQDWGRGVWPYVSFWNWGVATGVQDGTSIGVNFGARWTTGTGVNENALCIDGRLYKVSEDLVWEYDERDWKRPWRVHAPHTGMLDLTLEPVVVRTPKVGAGPIRSGGACAFGRWSGTIAFEGRSLAIRSLIGWAEEFDHRW